MKASKMLAWHVHVIGGVIALVVLLIIFFAMIKPKNDDTKVLQAAADAAVQGGGTVADNTKSAADVVKSKKDTERIKRDWSVYSVKYMPNIDWDKNVLAEYYLSTKINDLPAQWGRWVTNWYDAQKKDGITRSPGVEFPVPPLASDPNGIASLTSITLPTAKSPWKVSLICQTFDDAMAHLRRFNSMQGHGMPVIDAVNLSGHSPALMLTYNLSLYMIPGEAPPPADPHIGATSGGGQGGGGFGSGGSMGGMMSGKGGMSIPGMSAGGSGGGPGAGGSSGGPGASKGAK